MQYDVYNDRVIDKETKIEYVFKDMSIEEYNLIINNIDIEIYLLKKDMSSLKYKRFLRRWFKWKGQ
jgi:hypothetical protein